MWLAGIRFVLLELPALLFNLIFLFYWAFLAVLTMLCFFQFVIYLLAVALGHPILWIDPSR